MIHEIHLQSKRRDEMINITSQIEELVAKGNIQDGLVVVYSSHTTAGITINENADPDVQKIFCEDLMRFTHGIWLKISTLREILQRTKSEHRRVIPNCHYS